MSTITKTVYLLALLFLLSVLVPCAFSAVSTSASYQMASQVLDAGGERGVSTSFKMIGKTRDLSMGVPASASFLIGEGFLKTVYNAAVVLAPVVTKIDPSSGTNVGTASVVITGANYLTGAAVKLSKSGVPDIIATNITVTSTGRITCDFDLTGAAAGAYDVTVTNTDGRSGTLPSAFTVNNHAPQVDSIYPRRFINNAKAEIEITGSYFRAGATVKLAMPGYPDIVAEYVSVESSGKIIARFDITGKEVGYWDIVVTNDDSQSSSLLSMVAIEGPKVEIVGPVLPTISPFNPLTGVPTKIKYTLTKDTNVTLYIYNIRGERIWVWRAPAATSGGRAGINEVAWDGFSTFRELAGNGVYIIHIVAEVDGQTITIGKTKIAVIK